MKLSKHVTKISHFRLKEIRKISKQSRYQVTNVLKENTTPAFTDTGADISVMLLKCAKSIQLPLTNTKIKIQTYDYKPLKCVGYYNDTVMYGSSVANIQLYVVKPNVQTFLIGKICEELPSIYTHQFKKFTALN